ERPLAVAVAMVHPLRAHLAPARSGQGVDLRGHEPLSELAHHLPQQIVLVAVELLAQPRQRVHVVAVDHRVLPLVALSQELQEADAVVVASGGASPATPPPGTQLPRRWSRAPARATGCSWFRLAAVSDEPR